MFVFVWHIVVDSLMMFKLIQLFAAFHQRCCCWGLQLDFIVVVVYSLMSKVLLLTVLHKLIICCSWRLDIKGFADSLLLPLIAWHHRCRWGCQHNIIGSVDVEGSPRLDLKVVVVVDGLTISNRSTLSAKSTALL